MDPWSISRNGPCGPFIASNIFYSPAADGCHVPSRFQASRLTIDDPSDVRRMPSFTCGCAIVTHSAPVHVQVTAGLEEIMSHKKTAKATHPAMYAWRCGEDSGFNDCGESTAGRKLLKLLFDCEKDNTMVSVTRWFGGAHLGPARFRAIRSCAKDVLSPPK